MADANIKAVITAEDRASGVLKGFSSQLQSLAQVAGGAFALDRIVSFGAEFVAAFNKSQLATTELNSVLQSTGDISGVTARQATDLATSLSQVTTFSKTTTLAAEDVLLRFTNIGRDIFPQTLKATQDLATGLGTDLSGAAAIVGRALDAPANASRSLRSAQIVLNTSQQEFIKHLVDAGQGAKAQAYILDILKTKFGSLATAVGQTFGGQVQILKNNFDLLKEKMGEVIANALGPFIDRITKFVSNNQQLIVSLGIATLVAGGFAAAVITVAGALAVALAVSTPFTIALLAISALLGGVVFKAMQKFQSKMGDTTKGFVDGSRAIASNGENNFGAAAQAASDLAQKLSDINEEMGRATRDFKEQMAQMVQDHQQKVTDLKRQIDDETKSFTDAQTTQQRSHEAKVRNLETQIKALGITNSQADQQRINDLEVALGQENEAYQQDVDNATQSHTAKLTDFQDKLNSELAFLQKHGDDIAQVQNVQLLDELDKLKRSHVEQMAEYDKQRDRAIASAQQTTSGMAKNFNDLPGMVNTSSLHGVGAELGRDMAQAFKDSFKQSLNPQAIINTIQDAMRGLGDIMKIWAYYIASGRFGSKQMVQSLQEYQSTGAIRYHAEGGIFTNPHIGMVAEDGPEAIIPLNKPDRARQVMQNAGIMGQASSINITLQAGAFMGSAVEARKFAQQIANHIQDIAKSKNMTAAEMLG